METVAAGTVLPSIVGTGTGKPGGPVVATDGREIRAVPSAGGFFSIPPSRMSIRHYYFHRQY